jgi:hypothetical protein
MWEIARTDRADNSHWPGMSKTQAKPVLSENIEIILKIKLICRNMPLRLEYAITAKTLKICICICAYAFSKNPGPSDQLQNQRENGVVTINCILDM